MKNNVIYNFLFNPWKKQIRQKEFHWIQMIALKYSRHESQLSVRYAIGVKILLKSIEGCEENQSSNR